jgi:ADP-heptose:LPS heptosyltransferase
MNTDSVRHALLAAVAHLPLPVTQAAKPPRILLLRPDHLGDLLFMTPALHLLRTALPDAHIACLVGPWGQPVLEGNPDVDEVLTCDYPWFNRRPKPTPWQPYAALWQTVRRLRAQRFDVALVMRFDFWWGAALTRLAGIPVRIGYSVGDVEPFLSKALPYMPGRHEVEQSISLVQGALATASSAPTADATGATRGAPAGPLRFAIAAPDAAWADQHLVNGAAKSPPLPPFIAIHPGAGAAVKLWSVDGWVAVANTLALRHGATIVLTGGAAETALAQSIAERLAATCVNLAGQTSLGQLAAAFARCRLVLGADSGPLHLAVAAGAPTVHLFGPIDPAHFGPWGDRKRQVVVQAHYFDLPCHNQPCNRLDYTATDLPLHACMQTISVEAVLEAAEGVLAHTEPTA